MRIAIVGAGPTGCSLAIMLASKNHDIHLFDKNSFPIDKVCGEGIMPKGAEILEDIGVYQYLDPKEMSFFNEIINHDNAEISSGSLNKKALGVRRLNLSQAFYKRIKDFKNIRLHEQVKITSLSQLTEFHYIIGADGIHSKIRKLLKIDSFQPSLKRCGARIHFQEKLHQDKVEVHWNQGIEAYITPVGPELTELAFIWNTDLHSPQQEGLYQGLINHFPELKTRFPLYEGKINSYGPFPRASEEIYKDNIFLLGDALCFIDGITGEGISLGLEQAELWSQCIAHNGFDYDFYSKKINQIIKHYYFMTSFALFMSEHPTLRKFVIYLMRKAPSLGALIVNYNWNRKLDYSMIISSISEFAFSIKNSLILRKRLE